MVIYQQVKLVDIDMYRDLIEKQLLKLGGDAEKEKFFLLKEETAVRRAAIRDVGRCLDDQKTQLLLGYMERLTYLRNMLANYLPAQFAV